MTALHRSFRLLIAVLPLAAACDAEAPPSEVDSGCAASKCDEADSTEAAQSGVCVGLRGNGPRIWAHFGALAQIVEDVGPIEGAIGGSSGSVSAFITESVLMNPVFTCGDRTCTDEELRIERDRMALLFKSVEGYARFLQGRPEAMVFQDLAAVLRGASDSGFTQLADLNIEELESDPARTADELEAAARVVGELQSLLQQRAASSAATFARDLLGDELEQLALAPPSDDPTDNLVRLRKLRDIAEATRGFGSFTAEDPSLLVRPGLIDFDALTERLGVIANFYAGIDVDQAEFERFIEQCSEDTRGMSWSEISALAPGGASCQTQLEILIQDHWDNHDASMSNSRIDDFVGEHAPVVVSTSVLTGRTLEVWQTAMAHYDASGDHDYPWNNLDFEDTRFGYWGPPALTGAIVDNPHRFDDAKTAKALELGQTTWAEALRFSPAEPGLARAREIDANSPAMANLVSAGGWSDLFPVQAMRNMGCERSVFATTVASAHSFQDGLGRMLGMTDAEQSALYDADNPDSAFAQALSLAHEPGHAVLCTRWDDPSDVTDFVTLSAAGYEAPLTTSDPDAFPDASAMTTDELLEHYGATVPPDLQASNSIARGCLPPR